MSKNKDQKNHKNAETNVGASGVPNGADKTDTEQVILNGDNSSKAKDAADSTMSFNPQGPGDDADVDAKQSILNGGSGNNNASDAENEDSHEQSSAEANSSQMTEENKRLEKKKEKENKRLEKKKEKEERKLEKEKKRHLLQARILEKVERILEKIETMSQEAWHNRSTYGDGNGIIGNLLNDIQQKMGTTANQSEILSKINDNKALTLASAGVHKSYFDDVKVYISQEFQKWEDDILKDYLGRYISGLFNDLIKGLPKTSSGGTQPTTVAIKQIPMQNIENKLEGLQSKMDELSSKHNTENNLYHYIDNLNRLDAKISEMDNKLDGISKATIGNGVDFETKFNIAQEALNWIKESCFKAGRSSNDTEKLAFFSAIKDALDKFDNDIKNEGGK